MLGWRDQRPRPRDRWAFTTNAGKTRLTKMFQERHWEPQCSVQVTPPLMLAWSTEWQWEKSKKMAGSEAGWKVRQLLSETALANASLGWIYDWSFCCRYFGGIFTCFKPFLCTWLQVGFVVLGACSSHGSLTCPQPHLLGFCTSADISVCFFSWQSGTTLLSLSAGTRAVAGFRRSYEGRLVWVLRGESENDLKWLKHLSISCF